MKTQLFFATLALASLAFVPGCKKETPVPANHFHAALPLVIPVQSTAQAAVPLGLASGLAVLAGSSVTSTGATTVNGDIALKNSGSSIAGFPPGVLLGAKYVNDAVAGQAKLDLLAAYNDAAGRRSPDVTILPGEIGGLTLTPGLYKSLSSLSLSSGDLTFDAMGNANAIFIIQVGSSLSVTQSRRVILKGGAQAANIFWQVGSSATFGTASVFKGTILAMQSITFDTGAALSGRAMSHTGSVTMSACSISNQ